MKRVHLSADSALRDIFAFEEGKAVFDKFLPGMRARTENQAAVGGLSARRLVAYSGGAIFCEGGVPKIHWHDSWKISDFE